MSDDAVNALLNINEAKSDDGIKRDQYGRYLLADPTTGEIKAWTRATTLSGILDDTSALDTWKSRNLVFGIGRREDLFAMAASVGSTSDPEDKKVLDNVIDEARHAAAEPAKANLGTALHGFTQRYDLGDPDVAVPSQWFDDVKAYADKLKAEDMWPHNQFVEKVLLIPELGTAGTADRLLMQDGWKLPRIGDLKTGKVDGKGRSFAVQLAIYAHATHWFDPATGTYHEMEPVDQDAGIIVHLPVGAGRCDLYEVDLEAGWQAALLAHDIHTWRKRNDLCISFSKGAPANLKNDEYVKEEIEQAAEKRKTGNKKLKKSDVEAKRDSALAKARKKAEEQIAKPLPADHVEEPDPTHRSCLYCSDQIAIEEYEPHQAQHFFDARFAWCLARVKYVAETHNERAELASLWPNACGDIPTFKFGGPRTHEEIDRVAGACALVEMAKSLPFFEPDPAKAKETMNQWIQGDSYEQRQFASSK